MENLNNVRHIGILVPVLNDWESLDQLIHKLDILAQQEDLTWELIAVNDYPLDSNFTYIKERLRLEKISLLNLVRNVGHQRAIALGIAHCAKTFEGDALIVMDSDGEDKPEDVFRLVNQYKHSETPKVWVATREKRSESTTFKLFYALYLVLFRIIVGYQQPYGNFSLIPKDLLNSLSSSTELWMHYSSALRLLKMPIESIPVSRGNRYFGSSRMGFTSLMVHGLRGISIHRETATLRLLVFFAASSIFLIAGVLGTVGIRLFTELAIPGWATSVVGLLAIMFLQVSMITLFFIFIVIGMRSLGEFIPSRDGDLYIKNVKTV